MPVSAYIESNVELVDHAKLYGGVPPIPFAINVTLVSPIHNVGTSGKICTPSVDEKNTLMVSQVALVSQLPSG